MPQWTPEQNEIIHLNEPCDLLVSAAAGSGKTAVMTERIRHRAMTGQTEVASLLVMTFTDFAAQSMKSRIEASFREALQINISEQGRAEERALLNRQLSDLPQTQISTIHAFCWSVLQAFSSELTDRQGEPLLEAGFGVLEETRQRILLDEAVDEVLSMAYALSDALRQARAGDPQALADQLSEYGWPLTALATDPPSARPIPDHLFAQPTADPLSGPLPDERPISVECLIPTDWPAIDQPVRPFSLTREVCSLATWADGFDHMTDIFSNRKDDQAIREELVSRFHYLRSMHDYEQWSADQLNKLTAQSRQFAGSEAERILLSEFAGILERALDGLAAIKTCAYYEKLMDPGNTGKEDGAFCAAILQQTEVLHEISRLLTQAGSAGSVRPVWDDICACADRLTETPLLSRRGEAKKELAACYNSCVPEALFMLTGRPDPKKWPEGFRRQPVHLFAATTSLIESDLSQMISPLCRFFELVLLIDRAYMRRKIEDNHVDFSDFEHLSLRLLRQPEIQAHYRTRFKEIYLDEYQDINNIQEAIIRSIGQNNVFMVGDIKQSIYRFRHANPDLFNAKVQQYLSPAAQGRLMLLNRNFRSVPGILAGVNFVFRHILSEASGEINYDDQQALVPGKPTPAADVSDSGQPAIKLILVNTYEQTATTTDLTGMAIDPADGSSRTAADSSEMNPGKAEEAEENANIEKEALAVIREIRKLVRLDKICTYRQIAILGRTHSICAAYYDRLGQYGIPVSSGGEREFLDSPELRLMEALVQVLDNSQQDIPLAAVMQSGLVGPAFSEAELLQIRLAGQTAYDRHFHQALQRYASTGQEDSRPSDQKAVGDDRLRDKVNRFLQRLETWRLQEQYMSLSELFGLIFEQSGYPDRVSRLPFGESRLQDLYRFREWADQFEHSQRRGLYEFARHIRKIREQTLRSTGFDRVSTQGDAVQILTVHGSKGLEYPVIFMAGFNQNMTRSSRSSILQVSERGGITCLSVDPDRHEMHQTPANFLHSRQTRLAEQAEAYRLLYVGMTRAEDRLYLVGNLTMNPERGSATKLAFLQRVAESSRPGHPVAADLVHQAASYLDLVLLALSAGQVINPADLFGPQAEMTGIDRERTWSDKLFHLSLCPVGVLRRQVYAGLRQLSPEDDHTQSGNQAFTSSPEGDSASKTEFAGTGSAMETESPLFCAVPAAASLIPAATVMNPEAAVKQMVQMLSPTYHHAAAMYLPGKISVSGLKRRLQMLDQALAEAEDADPALHPFIPDINLVLHQPDPALFPDRSADREEPPPPSRRNLSGPALGTLLHSLFQYIDLAALRSVANQAEVARQLDRMCHKGQLDRTEREQALTYAPQLIRFAESELAGRILAADRGRGKGVYREMPFTLAVAMAELGGRADESGNPAEPGGRAGLAGDLTLIQGIIDCWFAEADAVVLIDFKSDQIKGDPPEVEIELKKKYQIQLDYYSRALQVATGKPVRQRLIWMIREGRAYSF